MVSNITHKLIYKFPEFFSLIYAYFIFYFFCKKKNNKKNSLNILVLNKHRYLGEIEALEKKFNINFYSFNHFTYSLISEPFIKTIRHKKKNKKWNEIYDKSFYKNYLKKHANFLEKFLKHFKKLSKINFILTPAIWYDQDKAWELAAKDIDIKYIALHKENNKETRANVLKIIVQKYKYFCPFYHGDYIFVYNNIEKHVLTKSKVLNDKSKIIVVGCPRFDQLYEPKLNSRKKVYITLFSFLENIVGYNQVGKKFKSEPFKISGQFSNKKYFLSVHRIFFESAIKNKNQKFIIKIKYDYIWKEKIIKIKKEVEKKFNTKIENVEIIAQEKLAKDILSESKVVIGINSLSLIEARIMNIPVLVPIFDEFKKEMKNKIHYSKFFKKELKKVDNEKLFKNLINFYSINKFKKKKIIQKNFVKNYIGFYDNKSSLRTYLKLKELNKNISAI